jgi:8-oxo-dGTP pyrophosphatase MutT (NUDIX family)
MAMVECEALLGGKKLVPSEKLAFRPGVYALIVLEGKVVLLTNRITGKYALPGGGFEPGEKIEDGLKREIREETGLEVEIGRFAHFEEYFFYHNSLDSAWHMLLFFYFCKPLTFDLVEDENVIDEGDEKPRWVDINALQADQFVGQGSITIQLLQRGG